jgi:protocatechuate 3,4-dioxygenase beta subunit
VSVRAALAIAVLTELLAPGIQWDAGREARALYERGDCAAALEACSARLEKLPDDGDALALAGQLLRDPRTVAGATSERVMAALAQHPALSRASVVPANEPGERLVLRGVVRDAKGIPLPGVRLHVFQTDKDGHYTPTKVMDEPHARLFAWLVTAADGRFELETIRPGGYPGTPERQGLEWRIPSHVHFELELAGFETRRFQLVFDDDPRMQPEYWREWAKKGKHPVVTLARDEQGELHGELEVVLAKP